MQVERFLEDAAKRFPDKTALVCGERRLRYAELEAESNRLAHGLIDLGVERGDRVAVYLDNSVEAVVSIFAVLKAGAVVHDGQPDHQVGEARAPARTTPRQRRSWPPGESSRASPIASRTARTCGRSWRRARRPGTIARRRTDRLLR